MNDSVVVRVLIADDHPLFREGMRGRLDRVGDIEVVGEAAGGDGAEPPRGRRYEVGTPVLAGFSQVRQASVDPFVLLASRNPG